MKITLSPGPLGQYRFTHNDKPIENLYVLDVKEVEGVNRVQVETVYIPPAESEKPEFRSLLEDSFKHK
jgi:hypothetical protein